MTVIICLFLCFTVGACFSSVWVVGSGVSLRAALLANCRHKKLHSGEREKILKTVNPHNGKSMRKIRPHDENNQNYPLISI